VIFTKPDKMNRMIKLVLFFVFIINIVVVFAQNEEGITVIPQPYEKALKNPLMGFTTNSVKDHPWASLAHTYFRWNELENNEKDGIDKDY
jgi:energy-converting hydrogenase Eha subunit F